MADSKITALTALTAADPANDMIPIVDVSDTPPASGNTKRISINNILACSPSATLASATITGDLTVDTNVLKVDSAGNRVSVNTTTFATDSAFAVKTTAGKFDIRAAGSLSVKLNSDQSMLYNVPTGNSHLFQINDSDAMTLNVNGLGVGVTPASLAGFGSTFRQKGVGAAGGIFTENNTGASWFGIYSGTSTSDAAAVTFTDGGSLRFAKTTAVGVTGFTELLRLKNGGQLRFVPLASDPAGAEAGDVYYNSSSNKLKCYNGTTWNDLF